MCAYLMACNRQENPAESGISISGHDEHVPESRALYQNWGWVAIKLWDFGGLSCAIFLSGMVPLFHQGVA